MNKYIEYTKLKYAPSKEYKKFIATANEKQYYGIVIPSNCLLLAYGKLHSNIKLITVAGFPPYQLWDVVGTNLAYQTALGLYHKSERQLIHELIDSPMVNELDMLFPMYWYGKDNKLRITSYLSLIRKAFARPIKVIIEAGTVFKTKKSLSDITKILSDSGVDYVKTNSGLIKQSFESLVTHVKILKDVTKLPIKASGGIRTEEEVKTLIKLGVKKIGTSVAI